MYRGRNVTGDYKMRKVKLILLIGMICSSLFASYNILSITSYNLETIYINHEIIGKSVGYHKILWLNRTVDLDKDGKDDNTGYDAKSYGFPEDGELFNKTIVISYRILAIQKSGIPK